MGVGDEGFQTTAAFYQVQAFCLYTPTFLMQPLLYLCKLRANNDLFPKFFTEIIINPSIFITTTR